MNLRQVAAEHGGTPSHCQHRNAGYCRRCTPPLHCWADAETAYQFTSAAPLVAFMREAGAAAAAATRAAYV